MLCARSSQLSLHQKSHNDGQSGQYNNQKVASKRAACRGDIETSAAS
jgi:hypothetical protein